MVNRESTSDIITSLGDGIREKVEALVENWSREGLPSRSTLASILQDLIDWRETTGSPGLWGSSPLMLTATLDDGWGHGIQLIELCGKAAGLRIHSLGLLQTPERIVSACHGLLPRVLGLTMLQFDSEEDCIHIRKNLPSETQMVIGGPLFRIDPDLASRIGAHFTARNATDFMSFLLKLEV